jgi:hypothetical protein
MRNILPYKNETNTNDGKSLFGIALNDVFLTHWFLKYIIDFNIKPNNLQVKTHFVR